MRSDFVASLRDSQQNCLKRRQGFCQDHSPPQKALRSESQLVSIVVILFEWSKRKKRVTYSAFDKLAVSWTTFVTRKDH